MEEIKSIRISELKDFKNHPFHVQQDMELCALMKSIEDEGVIVPLLVRSNPGGEGVMRRLQDTDERQQHSGRGLRKSRQLSESWMIIRR